MPNWVKNIIRVAGSERELERLKVTIASSQDQFDFNRIIPMPPELQIESGSSGENGLKLLYLEEDSPERKKKIEDAYHSLNPFFRHLSHTGKEAFENVSAEKQESWKHLAEEYLSNYEKHGHCTWYTWSYENWGTKWPAYAEEPSFVRAGASSYLEYIFTTAWSAPIPVFREITKEYPQLEFRGAFADEDTGSGNAGVWFRKNRGMQVLSRSENFAKSVWNYPAEESEEAV